MLAVNYLSFVAALTVVYGFIKFLRSYIKWWLSPLWSLPGPRDGSFLVGTLKGNKKMHLPKIQLFSSLYRSLAQGSFSKTFTFPQANLE